MCGRYYIEERDAAEAFGGWLAAMAEGGVSFKSGGEIFPTDTVPVIANSKRLEAAPFLMQWGYTLEGGKTVINARSETAGVKPMFREGMEKNRCLIPASNYFEWDRATKEKYSVRPEKSGLFCMAGIYRVEQGRPVFSILTRAPEPEIAFLHDRMPVLLPKEAEKDFLNLKYRAEDVFKAAAVKVACMPVQGNRQITLWE